MLDHDEKLAWRMAMSEGQRRPTRNSRKRFIEHCRAFLFGRHGTPPINALIAPATAPDDTGTGNEDPPPEPAWVELSRSSWL
jgi:hypothetical protein